jgi:hypothetical protein
MGSPHVRGQPPGGTLRLFIDGVLVASQSRPTFYSLPNTQCLIGRIGVSSYEYPAKMTVDEIALVIGEAVETADHAVRTTPFPAPDAAQGYQMTQSALIRERSVHRLLPVRPEPTSSTWRTAASTASWAP